MCKQYSESELLSLYENQPAKHIEDMVSLLRSLDYFHRLYLENQRGDQLENALTLGVLLDSLNRFGHCIMYELIEKLC